jgi:LacI family transcriptional regulator
MAVTMRDVARRAGVSIATVSKCLRGKPGIPERTRLAVASVAERLGYRTHPYIAALMHSRRRREGSPDDRPTLAFVTAFPSPEEWMKVPFFRTLYEGACSKAAERGYTLTHFWLLRDGMSHQRFSEMLRARGVRGIFLHPVPTPDVHLHLTWPYFSVVAHGLSIASPVFHRTTNDHYQSMLLCMHECRQLGYRLPAFALAEDISRRLEFRWESAFATMVGKLGFARHIDPLLFAQWDAARIAQWVRREKADVLLTLASEEQVQELIAAGLRVPEKVGLVSLSVRDMASPLSGVYQNQSLLGSIAADKLIDLVERNEVGVPEDPITLTVEGRWNPGKTVRAQAVRRIPVQTA